MGDQFKDQVDDYASAIQSEQAEQSEQVCGAAYVNFPNPYPGTGDFEMRAEQYLRATGFGVEYPF